MACQLIGASVLAAQRKGELYDDKNAIRCQEVFGDIDVRHLLSEVKAPTLILHARGDQRIPLDHGRELAAGIPDARMVTLESSRHIILEDEPAWQVCMDEITQFIDEHG